MPAEISPAPAEALASLRRRGRVTMAEAAFWLAALASFFLLPGKYLILTEIAILALFALSIDFLIGYAGIVSLGHTVFFGLGAYVAGLLAVGGLGDPLLGLAAAGAAAAALGLATSFLVLRGSDLTRLMVTLGIALIGAEIANKWSVTGGADGLQGVAMGPVLGLFEFDLFGRTAYAYALCVLFALVMAARVVMGSTFGLSLAAIKGNGMRARAIGVPVSARLVAVYALAALYAGVAGGLLAQTQAFVSLDVLAFHRSADGLLVLLIGGAGYLYGGLLGAIVFKLMQDQFAAWTPQYWQFWLGLFLVALVVIGRENLLAGPAAILRATGLRR